ncbi:MAG: class A beta-lactamase-related serine hydrolase [Sphingomonadaceae bacterium]|nr:class A beta-lactamase-related serine hydrolase [Sphingomonadaceae bacterium]
MASRIGQFFARIAGAVALTAISCAPISAAHANDSSDFEHAFDHAFGTDSRAPRTYDTPFEARIAALANAARGRIGVAAIDLSTNRSVEVLGNQLFPMASTSKIAIAATFLDGVEKNRWSLTSEFPLMIPVRSTPHSSSVAPVRRGKYMPAIDLIELMITRSNNAATDALLAVVGGPKAVNEWVERAGISDFRIDRDIATLVRDDGAIDPAVVIEKRDSATPLAMVQLLSGLHEGKWLSAHNRRVILGAMERCRTGKRRIPALLPEDANVAHKTGSLYNTSSDIGIIKTPDGRAFAVAIYVTGQGTRRNREARIATLARAIYDGYNSRPARYRRTASR